MGTHSLFHSIFCPGGIPLYSFHAKAKRVVRQRKLNLVESHKQTNCIIKRKNDITYFDTFNMVRPFLLYQFYGNEFVLFDNVTEMFELNIYSLEKWLGRVLKEGTNLKCI